MNFSIWFCYWHFTNDTQIDQNFEQLQKSRAFPEKYLPISKGWQQVIFPKDIRASALMYMK